MIRSYGATAVDQSGIVYAQRVVGRTNQTRQSVDKGRQKLKTKNQAALDGNKQAVSGESGLCCHLSCVLDTQINLTVAG